MKKLKLKISTILLICFAAALTFSNCDKPNPEKEACEAKHHPDSTYTWTNNKCTATYIGTTIEKKDTTLYFNMNNFMTKEKLQGAKKPGIGKIIIEIDNPDFNGVPVAVLKVMFGALLEMKNEKLFDSIVATKILVGDVAITDSEFITLLGKFGITATDKENEIALP